MSKSKKKKETKAVIAGQIAFWVSFLGIISLPIPGFWRFVGGFAIASRKLTMKSASSGRS